MSRLTKIDDLLFPVEEHPVFVNVSKARGVRQLSVPDKKAIVNCTTMRVLGVVGRGYRLVTNREALDMGFRCAGAIFPETISSEWSVQSVDAPSTGGYCYFDLAHNSAALDFTFVLAADRPEAFGPFIRVTNSYNALRALTFDVGFYRKVCKNGLIIPESIVHFSFRHAHHEISSAIAFHTDRTLLAKARSAFGEYLRVLRECVFPRKDFDRLIRGILRLTPPEPSRASELVAWSDLVAHLGMMCDKYAGELGENAYAVFNVITDFATHPPANRCVRRDRHSLQRLAGSWMGAFSRHCREPDFSLPRYLEKVDRAGIEASPLRDAQDQLILSTDTPRIGFELERKSQRA